MGTAALVTLALTIISGTLGDTTWDDKLHDALIAMDAVITEVSRSEYGTKLTEDVVQSLIDALTGLVGQLNGFESIDRSVKQIPPAQSSKMKDVAMKTKVDLLYPSQDFEYALGSILVELRKTHDLDLMCSNFQEISYKFTTKAICHNLLECSDENVCTAEKKCNVVQAIPKMAVVLWYKVAAFLSNGLCKPVVKKEILQDFKSMQDIADTIAAYASTTVEWNSIFEEIGKTGQVFRKQDVEHAMDLFKAHEKVAKFGYLACTELKSTKMCPVGYIYAEYKLLQKLREDRKNPPKIRNLQKQGRVNHGQMMELKKEAIHQITLLASIEDINTDIKTHSNEMSKYFHTLQTYDQGIAKQDIVFIKSKLKEFDQKAKETKNKVQKDFEKIKGIAIATKIAAQIEKLMADGFDALKGIGNTVVSAVEVEGLATDVFELNKDTQSLAENFKANTDQISDMETIVEEIKTGNMGAMGFEGMSFIEAYGKYTPKVDEHQLAKNDALWGAYKAKACDLLFEEEGIAASTAQTLVGMACEYLDGTLAEFAAVRGSIFQFQFDLVDALAKYIRSHIGRKLSRNMDITFNSGTYSDLMLIFFKSQSRLQDEASLYCNKLEYLNHGQSIFACNSTDLFIEQDIDNLIAYEPNTHYDIEERFVYIPTKEQFHGDQGYINLATLEKEHKVSFRLPANNSWLNEFNWLPSVENEAPFVESFKLYLPLKNYDVVKDRTKHYKTRIQITSKDGSFVNVSPSSVKYIVPLDNSQYVTVYEEGYDSAKCPRGKEILNPYSLCDNLPFMCDTMTRVPKSSVMPTILSRWELSLSVETGAEALSWVAPIPATDFLIIAKVELRFPPGIRKRSRIYRRDEPAYGCCDPGKYRPNWKQSACVACPLNTPRKMDGYYCEQFPSLK